MDSNVGFFFVICLTLVSLVKVSYAVQCYECTSVLDSNCADPVNTGSISQKTCPDGCAKLKAVLDDVQFLTRGCKSLIPSTTQVSDGDCASGQFSGNTADICACTGDLCNTATPMKISGAGLIVLCVLTVLLKMIL